MIKKLPAFLVLFAFVSNQILAQVNPPCPTPPPPGADNCPTACVYCNFDGYMGINNGTPSGGNIVCNQISIHNDQWFGFTAGSTTITITLYPSNCNNGDGLQCAFFDDCTDPDAIICNPGSGGAGNDPMVLSWDGFTIGETYFYMIDGWSGDVCNFEIEITEGSITPPPPDNAMPPQGPTELCPGATAVYHIDDVPAAGSYIWSAPTGSHINGMGASLNVDAPEGNTVTITFGNTGGDVCVQADNACNPPSAKNCVHVTVMPIPATVRPPLVICYEDAPFTWDEAPFPMLSVPGTFTLTSSPYESYLGCDSTVKQTIVVKQLPPTNLGTKYICAGTCFKLSGDEYCDPGTYNVLFESFQGCDSTVTFALVILNPVAVIPPPATSIDCNSAGVLLTSTGSTPLGQSSYAWSNVNWNVLGGTSSYNATLTGTYHLVVTSQAGGVQCRDTASVVVTGNTVPPGATATGGNINCLSPTAMVTGFSPTGGVNYTWTGPGINAGNQFQQNPVVSQAGIYVLTVKNPVNGCTSTASVTVLGDVTPPSANAVGDTINCAQASVTIDGSTNAAAASWIWMGPGINAGNQNVEDPNVLLAGTYKVTVTNTVNGCTNTASTTVVLNNTNPTGSAGPDPTLTCTNPNANLQGAGNAGGQPITFNWTGPNGFQSNVAQPSVSVAGAYFLTIFNTLNSCSIKDTVLVLANQLPPNAIAGKDTTITCAHPIIVLMSTGSSSGPNFTATWSGPGINAGNSNLYNPTVDQQGDYFLVITNTVNGCTATDSILVNINTSLPMADAGLDNQLTCASLNGVALNGSGTPATVTYRWTGPSIGVSNQSQQNPVVTQPGTYILVVTNPVNGCTAMDQVMVTQDADVPSADGGPDHVLNCSVLSVDFDGSNSSSGPGIEYLWSGPGITGLNETAQSPTGLSEPGTYNLVVTNTNNNCVNTAIVIIEIDTLSPVANAGNPLILNCFNNATDTLDASSSSTGANFTVLWSGPGINVGNQNSIQPVIFSAPGSYSLTVTNNNNTCTSTDQVIVSTNLIAPTADAGPDAIIDCVMTSSIIGGNSSSGANFTYLWTGPGINASNKGMSMPTVSLFGAYNIVVTNTINGCTATSDVLVNSNAVFPAATAGNDGLLTCANLVATLDGTASDTGANFQVLWTGPGINTGNQNQIAPDINLPGSYILAITNTGNSCTSFDTVLVMENKLTPIANAGTDLMLNCQTTSSSLNGSLSDSGPTIVFLWNGPGINASNQNDQSPPIDQPGNYQLLLTDTDNGCTSTDQVVVVQDNVLPLAAAGTDKLITCANQTQSLDGSGSSTGPAIIYVWDGPGINSNNFNLQSPVVNASGTYTLVVENTQNHCTATDIVFVDKNQTQPLIALGPDPTLTCAITVVQLDATQSASGPNISYIWSGPGIVPGGASSPTPSANKPGVYILTITDSTNGCTNVDAVNVGEDVVTPTVSAGSNLLITCDNATTGVMLNGTGSSAGPNYTILWAGPGINVSNQDVLEPMVLVPGTYTLSITDNLNGCGATDVAIVNADQNLPVANAGADPTITCSSPSVSLDGTGSSSPNGTLLFQWSGPGINTGNANSDMPSVTESGNYALTVTNSVTGCSASDVVTVNLDNLPPAAIASGTLISCANPSSTVTVTSSLPNSTYLWEGPAVNPNKKTDQTIMVDVAGLYAVTVTAPNGCTTVSSTIVNLDADVPQGAAEGAVLNCTNGGVSTISGQVISPAGTTFSWTGPGISPQTTEEVSVSQPGTYTFTMVAPNGCIRPITVNVATDFQKPVVNAFATDQIDCNTTEVIINGLGSSTGPNFTHVWSTSNGHFVSGINSLQPKVDKAGDYKLLIVNTINGCRDSVPVLVLVDPKVPQGFDLDIRNIRCFGDVNGSITVNGVLGGTQPFIFNLSGNTGSTNNQYTGLSAGNYLLALEDANGCHLDTSIVIADAGQLDVQLGPDIEVSLGETATVTAQIQSNIGLESTTWNYAPGCDTLDPFCETFTYQPFDTYRHTITVVDKNGCVDRDDILVIVEKNRKVYVPNIFNPNSDINFSLGVFVGIDVAKIRYFNVFDRWGNQVFHVNEYIPTPGATPDASQSWDGNAKGQKAQVGVYVWYCEVEFIDGEIKQFHGDITLIR